MKSSEFKFLRNDQYGAIVRAPNGFAYVVFRDPNGIHGWLVRAPSGQTVTRNHSKFFGRLVAAFEASRA